MKHLMKNLGFMVVSALAALGAVANPMNDMLFTISGRGPRPSCTNGVYAIVWSEVEGAEVSFNHDGTLSDQTNTFVLAYIPPRENGGMRPVLVQLPSEESGEWSSGWFSVWYLDGRPETEVRAYARVADDWLYEGRFTKMPLNSAMGEMVAANGYEPPAVEPVLEPDPVVVADAEPTNHISVAEEPIVELDQTTTVAEEPIEKPVEEPPSVQPETPMSDPIVSRHLPAKFLNHLLKKKGATIYRKASGDAIHYVYKERKIKASTYKGEYYIVKYDVYSLVPERCLDVCEMRKWRNRFSTQWVPRWAYVVGKTEASLFELLDGTDAMAEIETITFTTKKERSQVIRALKKRKDEEEEK